MIYQRALALGVRRAVYAQDGIPENITVDDLNVISDRALAFELVTEACQRRPRAEFQAYAVWLNSADTNDLAAEVAHRNMSLGS